ncbi:MAG: acyl-CoA mutase large subunit family protein [Verrucomicrobia bacterium]|nr:acyl-CoA mutase large subunit family protein [Verrucomicrobiota bacterium]
MSKNPEPSPAQSLDFARAAYTQWRTAVEADLQGAPFDKKLVTRTFEGVALQPLYTRADEAGLTHTAAQPGAAPFARGYSNSGYTAGTWEISQEIGGARALDFNCALLSDLMRGQNSVALTPDRAARNGQDPDVASASVGVDGVSVADATDLAAALKDVDLSALPVHVRAGANPLPLAAIYIAQAGKKGTAPAKLTGSLTGDPLGELAEQGSLPTTLASAYDSIATWTKWAEKNAPALATVGVNGASWLEAGGNAVQELAFAIATGVEYIRALSERGVQPASIVSRLRFTFAVGPQFYLEISKFRAFRLLWSRVAQGFGLNAEQSKVRIHARTNRWNKTVLDPHVNMLRVTTEAFSAVLGGIDSLHISPFDEVLGGSDEISRRIARNVHTLLSEEFHAIAPVDPAGGSWLVEKTTDELARKAWALFQDVEKHGGLAAALREGYVQKLVTTVAAEKDDAVSKRRLGLLGTNLFPNLKEKPIARPVTDLVALATARATEIKGRRPAAPQAAATDVDALVKAAAAGATIGQLAGLTAAAATEKITPLAFKRAGEGFEALRKTADAFAKKTGARPKIFLAKIGPVKQHKPRADFSAGFFSVGGFEATGKEAFETAEAAAKAAIASGAPVVVLCSTDETYPALVPIFAGSIKAAKPETVVVLAGMPADKAVVDSFHAAGVDEFIHVRANVRELLAKLLKQIGA